MTNETNSNTDENTYQTSDLNVSHTARFWILLLSDISSTICSLFLLYHFLSNKILRNRLSNHLMIILLIMGLFIQLIDMPFHLIFYSVGTVQSSTPATCLIWWFLDIGLYCACTIIMAWGSCERYLLIFHDRLFLNSKKRLIFHYLPYIILLLYTIIFYLVAIVFPPCKNIYDYKLPVCNDYPCYFHNSVLGGMDAIINNIAPVVIISVASLVIVIRVYYQKRRHQQPNVLRKQRKMIIQLLCISTLYLIPNFPLNSILFAQLCGLSQNFGVQFQLGFNFLSYFVIFLYPFVCLASQNELRKKIKWQDTFLFVRRPQQTATIRPQ